MIDMKNPNTLVSLAYIKTNKNPLHVFCNYVLYVLITAPNQSLRMDEIRDKLYSEFGLNMPLQMIQSCTRILRKSGELITLPDGGGYSIKDTTFDAAAFEGTRHRLHEQENRVLKAMADFVKLRYNLSWSEDDARKYLSVFLGEEGNGARIFLYEDIAVDNKQVNPSWYVAKYVSEIQKSPESIEKKYLEEIVNGMMIYQGIHQIGDYQQDRGQKFTGTVFYLDTKLVLRALGYSWEAQVQAAQELINLIIKKYGGKIGIFQQTLDEVQNALSKAGDYYNRRENASDIPDSELRIYAELNPIGASLLKENSTSVLPRLKEEYKVEIPGAFDWNASEIRRYSVEVSEITQYIISEKDWRHGAVANDVEIINQINILRKGDYSVRYGGRLKLPVFLTTNSELVYTFKQYVSEALAAGSSTKWNPHSLPIISDNMLLFRLWVPYANEYADLPAITLARFAYSAQNPNTQYFEKLRETATAYKKEKGLELVNLSEVRRQQLEEILVMNSKGDADLLTEEVVAMSIDELVKMENSSLHTQITDLQDAISNHGSELEKRDLRIIELASKPFVNKLGVWRLLILCAQWWWIVTTVLIAIGEKAIEQYVDVVLSGWWALVGVPGIIAALLGLIDKFVDENDIHHFALKKAIGVTWSKYSEKVTRRLAKEDLIYRDDILKYCLENTPIFRKYKKYCIREDNIH